MNKTTNTVKIAYLKANSEFETFYMYPVANGTVFGSVVNRKNDKNNLEFLMAGTKTAATLHPNNIAYTLGKLEISNSGVKTVHQWYSKIKEQGKLDELYVQGQKDKYIQDVIDLVHSVIQRTFDENNGKVAFAFSDFDDCPDLPSDYDAMEVDGKTCYYKTGFIKDELVAFYRNSKELIAA